MNIPRLNDQGLYSRSYRTIYEKVYCSVVRKPEIVSVLPNFTKKAELNEYTAAVDTPGLTDEEQAQLDELWENAFYLVDLEPEFREI